MEYHWLAVYDHHKALSQWDEHILNSWKPDQPIEMQGIIRSIVPMDDLKSGWLREPMEQNKDFSVEILEDKMHSSAVIFSQDKMKPERVKYSKVEQPLKIIAENPQRSIDRARVKSIVLLEKNDDLPLDERRAALVCHIPEGAKFILYRRIYRKTNVQTGADVGEPIVVWCLGCQSNMRGRNSQYVNLLWPDGHVETVDRFMENHPYFHPRGDFEDGKFVPKVHAHEGEEWDFDS